MGKYRKNYYDESIDVESYTCGSCENLEFDRDGGYCNQYHTYCELNDHCSKWNLSPEVYGGGPCFLTTACCSYKGFPDNCYELETLRSFRDNILIKTEAGQAIARQYYEIAPRIVKRIEVHPKKETILQYIYDQILEIIGLISEQKNKDAISKYTLMVYSVEEMIQEGDEKQENCRLRKNLLRQVPEEEWDGGVYANVKVKKRRQ